MVRLTHNEYWNLVWACLLVAMNLIRYGTEVRSGTGLLQEPVSQTDREAVRDSLMAMNTWQLTCETTHTMKHASACLHSDTLLPPFVGFSYSVESCKSVVLSAAMTEGHLTPQEAAELALLEQLFQVCPPPTPFPLLTCQAMHVCGVLRLLSCRRGDGAEWSGHTMWKNRT